MRIVEVDGYPTKQRNSERFSERNSASEQPELEETGIRGEREHPIDFAEHMTEESRNSAEESRKPTFWRKYRSYFLIALAVYALLIAFLVLFSAGPQEQPFIYQIF